jgi:biopolymer transport protein ExbD
LSRLDLDRELDAGESRHRVDLSSVELIRWETSAHDDEPDPLDEDEEAAAFTLSRGGPEKVEELDLAAMVDVAFQLVLFFLVTATTILYKSLEVPRPNPETPAAGAPQGKVPTLNDLKNDYILVEIDAGGAMRIDREPVASAMPALVARLRSARESTGRKAMLLSADATTPHRNAVLAYDAANEIGLGIAIARPGQKGDKSP